MTDPEEGRAWQPVAQAQRFVVLDILRGVALLGVLLVNLLSDFRIPLAQHLLTFHTDLNGADRAVDVGIALLLFYGYGLGLAGRIGSAAVGVGVGVALYAVQLALSCWWLRRYRFGPVEWLWRSLTYGCRQPIRRP